MGLVSQSGGCLFVGKRGGGDLFSFGNPKDTQWHPHSNSHKNPLNANGMGCVWERGIPLGVSGEIPNSCCPRDPITF